MPPALPHLDIPAPLCGLETGSFAQQTVMVRLPAIGKRILSENEFSEQVNRRLQALLDELPYGSIRSLSDLEAPDWTDWQQYLVPYLGMNWLAVPWFFAETYFYRRVLEATGYFQPGPGYRADPYAYQKSQGLHVFKESIRSSCVTTRSLLTEIKKTASLSAEQVEALILVNLWGNQADLSMWPAGQAERPEHTDQSRQLAHMPCNHVGQAAQYLLESKPHPRRVDILLDNAGLELIHDLLLAEFLLESGLAGTVRLHAKAHPTFVSDATILDIMKTVEFLEQIDSPETHQLSERLRFFGQQDQLQLRADFFWTSPLSMWEMPDRLYGELGEAALVISKGDANYRRLVGDRHWTYDTPLAEVWSYFPTSLLALRVSKSEVMIGLQPGQAQALAQLDPQWMTDGKWGLVQFYRHQPLTVSPP